jgi:hypothetical protein
MHAWAGARPRDERQFLREFAIRCLIAALAVVVCYQFSWDWLRALTADANIRLDELAGVYLQRVSFDTVAWQGQLYRYAIACTFADVWCGSLAFLWHKEEKPLTNFALIAFWTAALFGFNVFRLSVSDVLFAHGLSWNIAHNVGSCCGRVCRHTARHEAHKIPAFLLKSCKRPVNSVLSATFPLQCSSNLVVKVVLPDDIRH